MISFIVQDNHFGSAVSEILVYRQPDTHTYPYIRMRKKTKKKEYAGFP